MTRILKDKKESWPKQPEGITGRQICPISGLLPQDDNSCFPRFEYFIKGTEPQEKESLKMSVPIDKTTSKLAKPEQTENVEMQEKLVTKDSLGSLYCIDCAHESDPAQFIR